MKLNYKLLVATLFAFLMAIPSLFATTVTIMVGGSNGMSFVPSSGVTLNLGDTIKWEWQNGFHTTTSTTIPSGAAAWDETISSGITSFTYVPSIAGIYSYECIFHLPMMVGSFTVICNPPGIPTISPAGPIIACESDSSTLMTATADPGVDFQWNLNGNPISGANSQQYLPDTSGLYTCIVSNGCGSDTSLSVNVTLNPIPQPSFTFTNNGLVYSFTNTSTDTNLSFVWDFGDGNNSLEPNPQHTYTTAGHYTVILMATDSVGNGCHGQVSQEIDAGNTGINSIASGSDVFLLSPNPAKTYVNIKIENTNINLSIYDISGRLMEEPFIMNKSKDLVRLNVSMLPAGSYFIKIISKNKAITEKLIIMQ